MTDSAIIDGNYTDLKFMTGLEVARITVEIPIDKSAAFITEFGTPNRVKPARVAIARLHPGNGPDNAASPPRATPDAEADGQGRPRTFKERKRSEQAALKLGDTEFCAWMYDAHRGLVMQLEKEGYIKEGGLYEDYADTVLKYILHIKSKRELDTDPDKAEAWDRLYTSFTVRDTVR